MNRSVGVFRHRAHSVRRSVARTRDGGPPGAILATQTLVGPATRGPSR